MDGQTKELMKLFVLNNVLTSSQIAQIVGLSERTIRTRIKYLVTALDGSGAELESKPGIGYQLVIHDEGMFNTWYQSSQDITDVIPSSSTERVQFILMHLLEAEEYIRLEELREILYVSRNTITSDLKQVEYILSLYNLWIERRPNYGIKIEGEELYKRLCMANFTSTQDDIKSIIPFASEDKVIISEVIGSTVKRYRLKMPESVYENLIIHALIASNRIRLNHAMSYTEVARDELKRLVSDDMVEIAEGIIKQLEELLHIKYNGDETLYLALHLSGKAHLEAKGRFGNNLVISSKIDELVLLMLNKVYEEMRLDFRDNLELRMSLNQHMVPLDIRIRYDIPLKNPIIDQVKSEYTYAYAVAACACIVLGKHYSKEIPEDEIGYFAVLFALAIEKLDKEVRKYNIAVVCVSGRGTSQLFMYKYKQAFGKYINNIYDLSVFELEELDYEGLKIDYVFTTIPLNLSLPVPVYEVSLFLDNKEIDNVERLFLGGDDRFLYRYFNKSLFIPNLRVNSKEEALTAMMNHAKQYITLPDDFLDLVLKREEMGHTDLGNMVAIPHPYSIIPGKQFVVAAILEKPIWWGHNNVQVVFLISLSGNDDEDIEQFYRVLTNFISNAGLVSKTIQNQQFVNLIDQLKNALHG